MTTERFRPLHRDEMSAEQVAMLDALAASPRTAGIRGPFKALLRSPELGNRLQQVGTYIRFESSLKRSLNEMAILIAGRKWNAQYEFYAHRRYALEAGLRAEIVDAIARGERPEGMDEDEDAVWSFCTELMDTTEVSDRTYEAAAARFRENGVIDLIAALGYYCLVSMILNVDRVAMPPGEPPPLQPLR